MADYSTLISSIRAEVKQSPALRIQLKSLAQKLQSGSANYKDVYKISELLGKNTAEALRRAIGDGSGHILAELGQQLVQPVYQQMQGDVLNVASKVQDAMYEEQGWSFQSAKVTADSSRLSHIADRFAEATDLGEVSFLMGDDVATNIAKASVTDSIKANADAMRSAGAKVVISRTDASNCCEWCDSMCGAYESQNTPQNFWAVHKGCTCEFNYTSTLTGTRSKVTFSTVDGKLRKNTGSL